MDDPTHLRLQNAAYPGWARILGQVEVENCRDPDEPATAWVVQYESDGQLQLWATDHPHLEFKEERLTVAEAFDRAQPGKPGDVGLVMGMAGVRDEAELKLALRKVEEEGHKAALRIGRPPYGGVAAEAFCAGAIWKGAQRG